MQTYETLFITTPTLSDQEENEVVELLSQIVQQGGGTMVASDRMGRRRLAYPIQKHQDGVYVRFLYDSTADVPKELERRLRLSDRILRSLTVRLEPDWAAFAKDEAVRDAAARREAAEREASGEAGPDSAGLPESPLAARLLATRSAPPAGPRRGRRDDDDDEDEDDADEDDDR
jgi:small subunit ribosomal protein S6